MQAVKESAIKSDIFTKDTIAEPLRIISRFLAKKHCVSLNRGTKS